MEFKDINGKSKTLRAVKNSEGVITGMEHKGNANYFSSSKGVVHHPINKVVKSILHKIR